MEDLIRAGRIAADAREFARRLVKVDTSLLDVAEKTESRIKELGGEPAFPVNISLNSIAAHYTPFPGDETRFKEGDLVKLDIGVHINGYIGDTAVTVDLGNNSELVKAAEDALKEAIKAVCIGVKVREIGMVVHKAIQSHGLSPIVNLSGHEIKQYSLHTGLTIPNLDNGNERQLEKGQVIAIEPFATSGPGKVVDGRSSGIYRLEHRKQTRSKAAAKILKHIEQNFSRLPFARRWLSGFQALDFSLTTLEREKILYQYPQLVEVSKALVSQAEHTLLIDDKVTVLTA